MKKNAGLSTIMVTGLAAAISIFTMIILVVIKGAVGGPSTSSEVTKLAEQKADLIGSKFTEYVNQADLDVFWYSNTNAVVFVSKNDIKVMWKDGANIYDTTVSYDTSNFDGVADDDKKIEQARETVKTIIGMPGSHMLAPQVKSFMVYDSDTSSGKLTLKIEYKDAEKKTHVLEKEYVVKWTEGVEATKLLQQSK